MALVFVIAHHGRANAGKWRAIWRGRSDRLNPWFLVVRDDGQAPAIAVLALALRRSRGWGARSAALMPTNFSTRRSFTAATRRRGRPSSSCRPMPPMARRFCWFSERAGQGSRRWCAPAPHFPSSSACARPRARAARNWSRCSAAGNRALVRAPAHITGQEDSHERNTSRPATRAPPD